MSIREKVVQTSTYKSLNPLQRDMILKKANLQKLEHAVTVAGNIGLDESLNQSGLTDRNKNIIRDIFNLGNIAEPVIQKELLECHEVTLLPVQVKLMKKINTFLEYQSFLYKHLLPVISPGERILLVSPSGHVVAGNDLYQDNNYPVSVCLTVRPASASIPYKSTSNN